MLRLKACPRCHGDLIVAVSLDGRMVSCLQCGYTAEPDVAALRVAVVSAVRPAA